MMTALTTARDALATIPGVASCKVGFEANISPSDFPLIRLVPSRIIAGRPYHKRTAEVQIIFGAQTADSEGLETVYTNLFTLEASILAKVKTLAGRYIETLTDEDRLDAYKLMAVRVELEG